MKPLLILTLAFLFLSCSAKKATTSIASDCPEEGKCTVEILSNKRLEVKTDEFNSLYYQLLDASGTSVVVYRYDITVPDLQDANYREEIIFEINDAKPQIALSGKELQQTKMLFGRFCFCKGQTGNYKVEVGNLNLKKEGKSIWFDLQFSVHQVPQTISSIQAVIK